MDIKQQCITGYLTQGTGYRKLAAKYGVSSHDANSTRNKVKSNDPDIYNTILISPSRRGLHNIANVRRHETPAYKRALTS